MSIKIALVVGRDSLARFVGQDIQACSVEYFSFVPLPFCCSPNCQQKPELHIYSAATQWQDIISNCVRRARDWEPALHVNMFVPQGSTPASTTSQRNPRRRQRTHSDDSVAIRPPAKRQRKPLAEDTFQPLPNEKTNGHAALKSRATNGHPLPARSTRDASSDLTNLAYRGSKKHERDKRGGGGDGNNVLVSFDDLCDAMILGCVC